MQKKVLLNIRQRLKFDKVVLDQRKFDYENYVKMNLQWNVFSSSFIKTNTPNNISKTKNFEFFENEKDKKSRDVSLPKS